MSVTYRNQTEAPTAEGWHYGRSEDYLPIVPIWVGIEPLRKRPCAQLGNPVRWYPLSIIDWFGPVPECREG